LCIGHRLVHKVPKKEPTRSLLRLGALGVCRRSCRRSTFGVRGRCALGISRRSTLAVSRRSTLAISRRSTLAVSRRSRALRRRWRRRRVGSGFLGGLLTLLDELDGIGDVLAAVLGTLDGRGKRRIRARLVDELPILLGS